MSDLVKICRIDTLLGAKLAADAGADFVGLHMLNEERYPFRRESFRRITSYLRSHNPSCIPVLLFDVSVSSPTYIAERSAEISISVIQLHFQASPEFLRSINEACLALGKRRPLVVKVIEVNSNDISSTQGETSVWSEWAWGILFDTKFHGGTGTRFDWRNAAPAFKAVKHGRSFIAGGINAKNVRQAFESGAWVADAQSSLDPGTPSWRGTQLPRQKDPVAVVEFLAAAKEMTASAKWESYRSRRARPRVLFSPNSFDMNEGTQLLIKLALTVVDGVQIDAADGTANVSKWPIDAAEWAMAVRAHVSEAPIWLHLFSCDLNWIRQVVASVRTVTEHVAAVIVQPNVEVDEVLALLTMLRTVIDLPCLPSLTVGAIERAQKVGALERVVRQNSWVQVTVPMTRSTDRLSGAIDSLRQAGAWVHLDRDVDAALVRELTHRPDGATVGRSVGADVSTGLEELQRALGHDVW